MAERRQNIVWVIFSILYFGLLFAGAAAHRNLAGASGSRAGSMYRVVKVVRSSRRDVSESLAALRQSTWLAGALTSLEQPATAKRQAPTLVISQPDEKVAHLVSSRSKPGLSFPSAEVIPFDAQLKAPALVSPDHAVDSPTDKSPQSHRCDAQRSAWHRPDDLLARLNYLAQHVETAGWAVSVRNRVLALVDVRSPVVDERAILEQLRQAVDVEALSGQLSDFGLAVEWRRAGHALGRHVAVWTAARSALVRSEDEDPTWRQVAIAARAPGNSAFDIAALLDEEQLCLDCLAQLETYEADLSPDLAHRIAERCHRLASSPRTEDRVLGQLIENEYRNCNVRVSITDEMLNRLLPQPAPKHEPVRDTILGLPVSGRSTTSARLAVELVPDPTRLRLNLLASGQAAATTAAFSGPVTLWGESDSRFQVRKPLEIGLHGIIAGRALADARAANRLRNLITRFDAIPLLGGLMRDYALGQHDRTKADAEREIEWKVADRARSQFDATAAQELAAVNRQLDQAVLIPLRRMSLTPSWMLAETTGRRLTVRVRLANDEQLGAHTPRPRAPSDSLASLQVHQTAFNNLLDRLDLAGRKFTAHELYRHVAEKLNRPACDVPDTVPEDLALTFAPRDAMRISCTGGRIELRLMLTELHFENKRWSDLLVRAYYRPQPALQTVELVRDGVVHLKGERLSHHSQIMLRGLFSRMFPRDGGLAILKDELAANRGLRGLAITQFDVVDGWIGIAVGPAKNAPPAVARASR